MAVTGDGARTGTGIPEGMPQQRDTKDTQQPDVQQAAAPPAPAGGRAAEEKHAGAREIVLDFLERAGWTAGQVFVATLLAGGTAVAAANLPWKYASVVALSAGLASLVLTAIQYLGQWLTRKTITHFWTDTLVRLAKTFLASLAGSFAAAHPFDIVTFNWTAAFNLAAVAVLTALGKALLARAGDTGAAAAQASGMKAGGVPARGVPAVRTPSTLPTRDYVAVQQMLAGRPETTAVAT